MRIVGLISGGKDSIYNLMQCIAAGHTIVALANVAPYAKNEIDSYMYQSVGHEAIDLVAAAIGLPLFKKETQGKSSHQGKTYETTENDEVEDLYDLLNEVKGNIDIEGVSVGAILSDYQRTRVENVCMRLNLVPLAYLWQRDQKELLEEMINCKIDAIFIKIACLGLDPTKHLGRNLSSVNNYLESLNKKYGVNVCGEGGEYETLTLDCPLYKSRINIESSNIVMHSNDPITSVAYLKLNKLRLENKGGFTNIIEDRLRGIAIKDSDGYVTDQGEDANEMDECEIDKDHDVLNVKSLIEKKHLDDQPKQKITFSKSHFGWVWIGGIQGTSKDPKEAMEDAMQKLRYVLNENNHDVKNVLSVTLYISDMGQYSDLNKVYCDTFNHINPPTRACVETPMNENCPIIVEILSWSLPEDTPSEVSIERHTMHVQSRSHWAPANIGPYSQGTKVGDTIHLAGQIGLVPGSLELVKGGIKAQCRLALRHIGRLLDAMSSGTNLRDVVQGVCYVTDIAFVSRARELWEEKTNDAIVNYVVVSGLPKNALVEWHVWAHMHNDQFEYEETGECVDSWSISIFCRWNYENNVAAIVCHLETNDCQADVTNSILEKTIDCTILKLKQGHENDTGCLFNLKLFYSVRYAHLISRCLNYLESLVQNMALVYTVVPVISLKDINTIISLSGVRNQ